MPQNSWLPSILAHHRPTPARRRCGIALAQSQPAFRLHGAQVRERRVLLLWSQDAQERELRGGEAVSSTIHVMMSPDEPLREFESICSESKDTEVVFHPSCTRYADGVMCLLCGEMSASRREMMQ